MQNSHPAGRPLHHGDPTPCSHRGERRWFAQLLLLVVALGCVACPSKEGLGFSTLSLLGPGVINDPENKSLRFDVLKFGLESACDEMSRRGAALKVRDGEPIVGRFFAKQCHSQIIDQPGRQSFAVRFEGRGYAWTNVTGRLGFESSGIIEFSPDFQLHGEAMYVYLRPRNVTAATFKTTLLESELGQTAMNMTQTNPDEVGQNILLSQLRRGLTVIRYSEKGETEFAVGLIPVGQVPYKPFQVQSDKRTLDNDQTEVHSGQQDLIGGFTVEDDDEALFLNVVLDGAPQVDVLIVPKQTGDVMLDTYTTARGASSLPAPAVFETVLAQGTPLTRAVPLPQGTYYLLIDHSAAIGQAAPPTQILDDRAAKLEYLIQLGDAP
jgi:hypothetical protein